MRTTSAVGIVCGRAAWAAALSIVVTGTAAGQSGQYFRGVNVSQAEWGDPLNETYGIGNYTYATAPTFNYFAARALPFIRLVVKWERLQPTLGGPLDTTQLGYLQQDVADAKAAGAVVSIVPHNEARYATLESQVANYDSDACIIDNPCPGSPVNVTSADFVDFWVKMSNVFMNEPAVVAYDLTNEPHDMGVANWNTIAQTALAAIRANGDNKTIMIPGDGWSNATYWSSYNGSAPFITDPANNYYYEAHLYFDSDFSGTYAETYDQELAANPNMATVGATRLAPFVSWCQTNNVPCYLGEYGIPNDDPRWLTVLDNFLIALDQAGMPGTYWAAGELWATVPTCTCSFLSVEPSNNFTTDAEQLPTLLGHLKPATLVTLSSAADYGWATAPGELVTGYGNATLATGTGPATELPLPTTLEGAQVQVTDSSGNATLAPLLYASPGQINYQVPSGVAAGLATVAVLNGSDTVATGVLEVQATAPTIFTANEQGTGVPAALIQRVHPDGTYDYEGVASPIAFDGDSLYLLLYGTGFDAASKSGTTVTVGGTSTTVTFAGPAPGFSGEDQIDAQLPSTLTGAGSVTVTVTINGATANAVTLAFQ
ncbi:MAG TPA: cellulase family glycosylhydrolase [Bryobacteraceae bacterium]|nr:cellulase family glycosylhydrolase [Bryobacteraceae bacterium]